MIRSKQKSEQFLIKELKERTDLLSEDFASLESGEINEDRIDPYKRFMVTQLINLFVTRYSAGKPLQCILENSNKLIQLIGDSWTEGIEYKESNGYYFDDYVKLVWILSLGELLTIPLSNLEQLVNLVDRTGHKDWLLEYLISPRIADRAAIETLIFPKPYASLKKAVDEPDPAKQSAIVKRYLEKEWYPGHKEAYWHDNHKSRHDTFFGYWSFEAAAVVKIAGIDDSSFRDNQYYPKDLLL